MKTKQVNIIILMVLVMLLFTPLFHLEYRYIWDLGSGKLASSFSDSGIFKNLQAELTHDYENMTVYGYNLKFPILYVAIITQLFIIIKTQYKPQMAQWLYVCNMVAYIFIQVLFLASFGQHKFVFNVKIGIIIYGILLLLGIIIHQKKLLNY